MAQSVRMAVSEQMKQALKGRQPDRLSVLRMILSEIDAARGRDASADELAAVKGYHKRLVKGREDYVKAGDPDRLAQLDREIAVVAEFLPAAMPDSELEQVVEQLIAEGGYTQRDFGRAMKEIMSRCGGEVDGGRASAVLKAKLAGA